MEIKEYCLEKLGNLITRSLTILKVPEIQKTVYYTTYNALDPDQRFAYLCMVIDGLHETYTEHRILLEIAFTEMDIVFDYLYPLIRFYYGNTKNPIMKTFISDALDSLIWIKPENITSEMRDEFRELLWKYLRCFFTVLKKENIPEEYRPWETLTEVNPSNQIDYGEMSAQISQNLERKSQSEPIPIPIPIQYRRPQINTYYYYHHVPQGTRSQEQEDYRERDFQGLFGFFTNSVSSSIFIDDDGGLPDHFFERKIEEIHDESRGDAEQGNPNAVQCESIGKISSEKSTEEGSVD
ncbi:MAG: hypothetical protein QW303_01440 [Nitrososphaerota archaeon]